MICIWSQPNTILISLLQFSSKALIGLEVKNITHWVKDLQGIEYRWVEEVKDQRRPVTRYQWILEIEELDFTPTPSIQKPIPSPYWFQHAQ